MKKMLKQQVMAALAVTAVLGAAGGMTVQATDTDHILASQDTINKNNGVLNGESYWYGVVGGNAYLDSTAQYEGESVDGGLKGTANALKNLAEMGNVDLSDVTDVLDKTKSAEAGKDTTIDGDAGLSTAIAEGTNPSVVRFYGAVGGDLSLNTGLRANGEDGGLSLTFTGNQPQSLLLETADTSIVRNGNVVNNLGGKDEEGNSLSGGSFIGGVGGSAAAALGNITVEGSYSKDIVSGVMTATVSADLKLDGKTSATVNGDVTTNVAKDTNVIGWTNGGLAAGIGGTASSTVTGNTTLTIDGTDRTIRTEDFETPGKDDILPQITTALKVMEGSGISAIGVTGGGTAVTTLGGTANAAVGGSTTVNVNNATVIGVIGGGAAASVDATGVAEAVMPKIAASEQGKQYGNDEGFVDVTGKQLETLLGTKIPDDLKITATDAIDGGTATSTTGDTNIALTGKTTAAGVFGGGAAAAYHTYQLKADKEGVGKAGNEYGSSTATAETGKSTITIGLTDNGTAMGVFGGGAAFAYSETGNGVAAESGAAAAATTNGSKITVIGNGDMKDHVGGLFGGGAAVAFNWANATAEMTDAVDITIAGADVSGVAGNGLAYFTGTANTGKVGETYGLKGMATAKAADTTINVMDGSTVAGILGGGIAIDDTQADVTNATAETTGKATINVNGGTVKTVDMSDLSSVSYLDGITNAAGDAAIAAGGVALGGGAAANVAEAEVNINGGTVEGNIYGGGIAAYGWEKAGGSHVGTSTINLNGGTVNGDVYAGGAASSTELSGHTGYTHATATVDTAVINLAGTDVKGILSGTGKVTGGGDTAIATVGESTLNLIGTNTLAPVSGQSKIQNFTNVVATAGSETIIGKDFSTESDPLISGGKVTVEDGALLNVENLAQKTTNTYTIAAGTSDESTFWDDSDLIYDRMSGVYATTKVDQGTNDASDTVFTVTYQKIEDEKVANEAADSMAESLGAQGLRGMFREGMNDQWQGLNEGSESYLDDWQLADNKTPYQKGAMIGEDAAVTGNTVSIARDMADNVMQRLSFTDDYVQDAGWVNENGGIWAKYIHRTYDTDAMGSSMGGIHSSTDYDGAIVGVDFGKSGKFQSGVAFHYGSGDGHGLVSRNDYDAWGITMYGSMKDEAAGTNLMADIGWMTSDNDIDGTVEGKSMSADRDVDAWTIGLRGEKEYVFGRNQLVPYVGLRYMSVNPGSYTAYYNGQAAFNYDADNQNLWMLPIGVSFRNETVTAGGWRITPKLDLSYIWAFGDTDTDMTVNAGAYSDSLYYDVMDDSSWLASLGVEASKDVWSFGLGYGYQKGDDEKNRTWFVNASYAF